MALPAWALKGGKKGAGKTLFWMLAGFLAFIIALCGIVAELLSAFNGHVVDDSFDPYSIQVYEDTAQIHQELYDEQNEEMEEIEERLIEENTHTVDNGDGTTSEVCDIDVVRIPTYVNVSYTLAYITYTDENVHRWKSASLKEDKILDFLRSISTVKVSDRIDDTYYVWNEILSAEDVADLYFPDDELDNQMYTASFDLYVSFFDKEGIITDSSWKYVNGELQQEAVLHDTGLGVPQYYQTSYPNVKYGNGTIASSGCAPTCIAMVASYATGRTITPVDVVDWAGNRYYVSGAGSSWGIFAAAAKNYGMSCRNIGKSQAAVLAALESGQPVIASMGKGTFTKGGHFIVIRGATTDGYFLVNDPNKKNYDKYKTDKFKTSVVFAEAKNFWCFG